MFRLELDTDNDAFTWVPAGEVARILRQLADGMDPDWRQGEGSIVDRNGVKVGEWKLTQGGD